MLTNWYANRKRETGGGGAAVYGPRRNSISNLFFNPEKKASSSPLAELRQVSGSRDKLRKSMLNLEEILLGEGVAGRGVLANHGSGKGIKRSESAGAKFAKEVAASFIHNLILSTVTCYTPSGFSLL